MKRARETLKAAIVSILLVGTGISACAGRMEFGGQASWEEEVLSHDGGKMLVERTATRRGRHEIGQQPPIGDQSLAFMMPKTNQRVVWKDEYSEDVGSANFNLMLLDIVQGVAYLLATPAGCLSYNKWGRPNPPYVVFKYQGKEWRRIPLQELPVEIVRPNLLHSSPDRVAARTQIQGIVPAAVIRKETDEYRQPEYRSILRDPIKGGEKNCAEMVYDGKGGWVGIGWFRDQPSYEACLKYCARNRIETPHCPCNRFFEGEK